MGTITKRIGSVCVLGTALAACGPAAAADAWSDEFPSNHYYFQTSVATRHFDPSPDQNNQQGLLNVERHWDDGSLLGGATFRNTFNQQTTYAYVGRQFGIPLLNEAFYAKLTGGLLYGYRGEYQDRIPLNKYGVAPAIIPSVGFRGSNNVGGELVVFGTAGVMATLGFTF